MTTRAPTAALLPSLLLALTRTTRALFPRHLPRLLLVAAVLLAARAQAAPGAEAEVRLRRFALLVGVNDGGPQRPRLRYAESDARSVARVMETLGGVASSDLVFVADATRGALVAGFDRVRALAATTPAGVRRELLVYYSGHSDEDGLLVGAERLDYDELRKRIQAVPAEVRMAILDSCGSGAFTRQKGGVHRAPFLLDASADMRGHAFLTSSAVNEVAQESDRIGASFFTHYLVSGLRGAADTDGDRRVTLLEAYQFASQETLARTERTRGGPQHAAFEFELAGTGALVVTDVRSPQAGLVLGRDLGGRITVRSADGGLVAELRKNAGRTVELGLEAGQYHVTADEGGRPLAADVALVAGQRAEVSRSGLHPDSPLEVAVARGDLDTSFPTRTVPGYLGLVGNDESRATKVEGIAAALLVADVWGFRGVELAFGLAQSNHDMRGVQLAIGGTRARGTSRGVQLADGVNMAEGDFAGAQLGALVDYSSGRFRGAQITGLAAWGEGRTTGLQLAGGLAFHRGQIDGVQLAPVTGADTFRGLQLAAVSWAREGRGLQLAAVNVAGDMTGLQLSAVNVAGQMHGFQLGVVNVARAQDGESFGLLNFIGNGIQDAAVYASDAFATNFALKLGSRHLYTALTAAFNPGDELSAGEPQHYRRGSRRFGFGLGLGWRFALPFGRLDQLELEAHGMEVHHDFDDWGDEPLLSGLRAQIGVRLAPQVRLLAGAGLNVAVGWKRRDLDLAATGLEKVYRSGDTTVRIFPGLLLGLQI